MNDQDLCLLLEKLLVEPDETEWLEFKENYYEPQLLGEYFSALANSACLNSKPKGYLVFGIKNTTHEVVGTDFNPERKRKGNQLLLLWLANGLNPNVGFEYYIFLYKGQRIVFFEIRAAFDRPVKFYGTAYIRIGSSKTELSKHPEKERQIWQKGIDWSAQICEKASLKDLDTEAIKKARTEFINKYPSKLSDVIQWDDTTFLNKVKLTIQGDITNTAIILLGKPESSTLISPSIARISWILRDEQNNEKDYAHFEPPFIINVDKILVKIRNLTFRALPSGTLFPVEIPQYDPWILREALHNCISHQDYSMRGRVIITEFPDRLIFTNMGSFIPGSVENVIRQDAPQTVYRNSFLAEAMVNLNMIDTQGGGIKRMFITQIKRFFPMPDYDLSESNIVKVSLSGTILDERYSRLLMENSDLDLWTVILLDKIQKKIKINSEEYKFLKSKRLVEGRYPNIYVAAKVAAITGGQARHIRNRGLNKKYYQEMIIELLKTHQPLGRDKIDELLLNKLPEVLSQKQQKSKIHNILTEMSALGLIENVGSRRWSKWILKKSIAKNKN